MTGSSIDLTDGFYHFRNRNLASWFTFPLENLTAQELGVDMIYDEQECRDVPVAPDTYVWAAFEAMPMGWAWALWMCRETLTDVMLTASRRFA